VFGDQEMHRSELEDPSFSNLKMQQSITLPKFSSPAKQLNKSKAFNLLQDLKQDIV